MQHDLTNWIPYKLTTEKEEIQVKWLFLGDKLFTEPFFDETILACKKLPENSSFFASASSLSWLADVAASADFLPPDGLIFHVSRCGSTLLSQLIGLKPDTIVLSEVPILDDILNLETSKIPALQTKKELVSAVVKLLGKKRQKTQQHLFVKLDCWHLFYYEMLREIFPDVPFFLLYRNPSEVLASHRKLRGKHMVPGLANLALSGLGNCTTDFANLDAFAIKILEAYFRKLVAIAAKNDPYSFFLNYNSGAAHHVNVVAAKTGLHFTEQELVEIEKRCGFHSKFPNQVFSEHISPAKSTEDLAAVSELYWLLHKETNTRLQGAKTSQPEGNSAQMLSY